MSLKIYRCAWCGSFTNSEGEVLEERLFKKAESIIKKYGDKRKTQLLNGECCPKGYG